MWHSRFLTAESFQYGSEIWGFESRNQIEKIHLRFCKFVPGVGQSANSTTVLGKCGRLPLHIKAHHCKQVTKCKQTLMQYIREAGLQTLKSFYFRMDLALYG